MTLGTDFVISKTTNLFPTKNRAGRTLHCKDAQKGPRIHRTSHVKAEVGGTPNTHAVQATLSTEAGLANPSLRAGPQKQTKLGAEPKRVAVNYWAVVWRLRTG